MADLDTTVLEFLRDASWRIAELTLEMDNMESKDIPQYKEKDRIRLELYLFMDVIYFGRNEIKDGYNYALQTFTEAELFAEMEYLRGMSGMNITPTFNFVPYYSQILNKIVEGGVESIPSGVYNDILIFNNNNELVLQQWPNIAGHYDGESAAAYFSGVTQGRSRYLKDPVFLTSEITTLNPTVPKGLVIWEVDDTSGSILGFKVGDGVTQYNDLNFMDQPKYTHSDPATVDIGDVKKDDVLYGEYVQDIIKKIVSPYLPSEVSGVTNNAAGAHANVAQMEIGQSISESVDFLFSVSNPSNLDGATPIEVETEDIFVENNPYPNAVIALVPTETLAPTEAIIYTITIRANHKNQETQETGYTEDSCTIRFDPRYLWGASDLDDLTTSAEANQLTGGGFKVASDPPDFEINSSGYLWVLIPSSLGLTPVFYDITDGGASLIEMVNKGTLQVNNGVGNYNYDKFRSPYKITEVSKSILRADV